MIYCRKCGNPMEDGSNFCPVCGNPVQSVNTSYYAGQQYAQDRSYTANYYGAASYPAVKRRDDSLATVAKVFLILGCVSEGWLIIPLAWCLPITIKICNCLRDNQPISTGLKVCALLFVNVVAGIMLLCMED